MSVDTVNVTVSTAAPVTVTPTLPPPVTVTGGAAQGMSGPPGSVGPAGPPGPPGPPGPAGGTTFDYSQPTASAVWDIVHNLGRYPSVTVVDSSNREVDGDVQYASVNEVVVSFSAPFSGSAFLN